MRRVVVLLLFAVSLRAQDAATLALAVGDASVEPARISERLKSPDALTRATAARVVLVRDLGAVVPQLREALAAEKNAEAAREEVRALVMLGTDDDIVFAKEHLARFPASIDGDFADAVARLGTPRAIDLYLKHVRGLRAPVAPLKLALWGRSAHATAMASRLLGVNDPRGFDALLRAFTDSRVALDPGLATAALGSSSSAIRTSVIWHLAEANAPEPARIPASLREAATAPREDASTEESFGREVLRRMLGAKPNEQKEWLEWMRTQPGRAGVPRRPEVLGYLTFAEQDALNPALPSSGDVVKPTAPTQGSISVNPPSFTVPLLLPPGLPEAILKQAGCKTGWIGTVETTVDRAGRVQSVNLEKVGADAPCKAALETMMRLSLADPTSFVAPLTASGLLVVKTRGDTQCMDAGLVDDVPSAGVLRAGGAVVPPVVTRREEPLFPESVRQAMKGGSVLVHLESRISKTGCVRDIRIVKQSQFPELNGAAVLALSKWKFKPGTLDGVPVDVLFALPISFRTN